MTPTHSDDTATFERTTAIAATDKAVLCELDDGTQHWVPQSQIHEDSEVWKRGDTGTLVVTQWWAEKQGLV